MRVSHKFCLQILPALRGQDNEKRLSHAINATTVGVTKFRLQRS
jgi:hypothetical protein